ncbi:MAG: serine hydroxymethyltransferase, partial [Nonomuraea sp.]|nr:serine hydroxymethyltransferase [Nonomuraea sp.]
MSSLASVDPQLAELIKAEERRQADTVKLIASENYVSKAVLEATGTVLTNK